MLLMYKTTHGTPEGGLLTADFAGWSWSVATVAKEVRYGG